jgi:hypothetical protein
MNLHQSLIFILLVVGGGTAAGEHEKPFVYPEAQYANGRLTYVDDVPVLIVAGTPREIGEQIGVLAVKPAAKLITKTVLDAVRDQLGDRFQDAGWFALKLLANGMYSKFPAEYRTEIDAMARAGEIDRNLLIVANTIRGLRASLTGCSGLAVEVQRSATGRLLFGRNHDMSPVGDIAKLGLVIVYLPTEGRPLAVISVPGLLMFGSGMNSSCLVIGSNAASNAADKSPRFAPNGTPTSVALRKLLETCRNRHDAIQLFDEHPAMIQGIVTLCDEKGAVIVEVTPQSHVILEAKRGLLYCTNTFRSRELRTLESVGRRYSTLAMSEKLSVVDVWRLLHGASQGAWTIHTMIFEPDRSTIHVAFGDGRTSASARKMTSIDLSEWLRCR